MTAGAIVNMGIGIAWVLGGNDIQLTLGDLKDVVTSPLVAVVTLLLVYAVGGLVEVLADLFVTRLTGNTVWAFISPMYMFQERQTFLRLILRALTYYPGIFVLLYFEWVKAFIGRSSYRWRNLDQQLKSGTRDHLKTYPEIIKDGLKDPFGKHGDLPWLYFAYHGTNDDVKVLARKLENRKQDVLVIVTSFLISAAIVLSVYDPAGDTEKGGHLFALQLLMLVPVVFLGSYFLLLKQSILTILEYNAFTFETTSTPKEPYIVTPPNSEPAAPEILTENGDGDR
jgi:ABC-type multidrug transport system fused ATPase/permease subunit